MEVHLANSHGLPKDCVISIRAGSTRRQAPLSAGQAFRFPSLPFNAKPFKVDILTTVSSQRFDLCPGQEQYHVSMDGSDAHLDLVVKEAPYLCGKGAVELRERDKAFRAGLERADVMTEVSEVSESQVTSLSPKARLQSAVDAREYLEEHNLFKFTQEMIQYLIREKPATPYAFMATYLTKKAEELGELPRAQAEFQEANEPLPKVGEETVPGQTNVQDGAETAAETGSPQVEAPDVELAARSGHAEATASVKAETLAVAQPEDNREEEARLTAETKAVRKQAREMLDKSLEDGSLQTAMVSWSQLKAEERSVQTSTEMEAPDVELATAGVKAETLAAAQPEDDREEEPDAALNEKGYVQKVVDANLLAENAYSTRELRLLRKSLEEAPEARKPGR